MLMSLNGFDPLMLKDRYLIFLKHSQISRIRMMLQQLFQEFLTSHIYLDTNPRRKHLILLAQNQVDLPSEQLSIVFYTLNIPRRHFREWVHPLCIRG